MPADQHASLRQVTLVASDLAASIAFYDAVLAELGLNRAAEFGDEEEPDFDVEAAGWGPPDEPPLLWVVAGAAATRGAYVSFRAPTRAAVVAFHGAALRAGGSSRDAPRRWPIYRRGEFNAVVTDPDGNAIEALAPE